MRAPRLLAPLLLLALAGAAAAQAPTPLTPGQTVADSLDADDTHAYTVALDAGQFVYAEADQQSVDVVITVLGPDGAQVKRVDASARGPEPFQFATDAAGAYRIEVAPFERQTGRYALVVSRVEPLATTPEGKVEQLVAAYDRPGTPGGVVAVVRDGAVAYAHAFGMADLTHAVPFTPETRTNIGSTSKQFTAFALVLLDQQGLVDLDADVRAYIPELPDFGETVTLRHLLTHTSGYREFLNLLAIGGMQPEDQFSHDRIVDLVARQPALQNAPGAEWNYNNTGYALAAEVVARVTGTPFDDWMDEHVFGPLGMDDTVVKTTRGQVIEGSAPGYAPTEEGAWRFAQDLDAAYGAGGIYTTAGDLARWLGNLADARLGGPEAVAVLTERGVLTSGDTLAYALGLFVDEHRGLRRVYHGGADTAHRAQLAYYPTLDAGVVVLSNNATFDAGGTAEAVAEAFFAEHMAPEEAPAAEASGPFDPADFDPETFDDYAGRYELEEAPGFVLTFSRDAGRFFTQATGQPQLEIFPTSDSTFALRVVEASVTFHRDADGVVRRATLHQNGDHPALRLEAEAWAPTAEDLAAYAGRYFSEEVETLYTLAVEDGKLVARHRRLGDVTLTPAPQPDQFTGDGIALLNVAFERDDAGAVTGFRVSNGRTRGVLFERFGR